MAKHILKTWIGYWEDVVKGIKKFEIRKNDRGFKSNDVLVLQEWDNHTEEYTGRELEIMVDYILEGGQFGLEKGYVCMSLSDMMKIK